jgi:hypothetical protein
VIGIGFSRRAVLIAIDEYKRQGKILLHPITTRIFISIKDIKNSECCLISPVGKNRFYL